MSLEITNGKLNSLSEKLDQLDKLYKSDKLKFYGLIKKQTFELKFNWAEKLNKGHEIYTLTLSKKLNEKNEKQAW